MENKSTISINNNYLIIMAGGVGSRFWPMSTSDCPKQFLDVLNIGRTLYSKPPTGLKE